jgi:dCMP deaminase
MTSDRWDAAYLRQCLDWAGMSKDPNTRVGAVIVGPDREVRASGFNGFPRGITDNAARLADRDLKNRLMVHAERNAICNAARIGTSLNGCTLYLMATDYTGATWGGPPCTACTIEVIQAGIVEVVSTPFKSVPSKWAADIAFARGLLEEAGVRFREVAPPE